MYLSVSAKNNRNRVTQEEKILQDKTLLCECKIGPNQQMMDPNDFLGSMGSQIWVDLGEYPCVASKKLLSNEKAIDPIINLNEDNTLNCFRNKAATKVVPRERPPLRDHCQIPKLTIKANDLQREETDIDDLCMSFLLLICFL
jgi:hypothetical protein